MSQSERSTKFEKKKHNFDQSIRLIVASKKVILRNIKSGADQKFSRRGRIFKKNFEYVDDLFFLGWAN